MQHKMKTDELHFRSSTEDNTSKQRKLEYMHVVRRQAEIVNGQHRHKRMSMATHTCALQPCRFMQFATYAEILRYMYMYV